MTSRDSYRSADLPLQAQERPQLALDCSGARPVVAIAWGGEVRDEWVGSEDLRHHETLLIGINTVLQRSSFKLEELSFLSVGVGPGLFTGLRIGITTARFLADPLNLPCVSVSSMVAMAAEAVRQCKTELAQGPRFWCISDAKSQRVYAQSFSLQQFEGGWDYSGDPDEAKAIRPELLAAEMGPKEILLGAGASLYKDFWPKDAKVLLGAEALTGGAVARVGQVRYALDQTLPPWELHPTYLKVNSP
jgi:tRNA threonylcarbamoyladenosine biosynthesis protein TsaB